MSQSKQPNVSSSPAITSSAPITSNSTAWQFANQQVRNRPDTSKSPSTGRSMKSAA